MTKELARRKAICSKKWRNRYDTKSRTNAALLSQPGMPRYLREMRIVAGYLLFAAIATTGCGQQTPTAADFAAQRQRMVEQHLKPRGIKDERVLAAMAKVPREEFIPLDARADAYESRATSAAQAFTAYSWDNA